MGVWMGYKAMKGKNINLMLPEHSSKEKIEVDRWLGVCND